MQNRKRSNFSSSNHQLSFPTFNSKGKSPSLEKSTRFSLFWLMDGITRSDTGSSLQSECSFKMHNLRDLDSDFGFALIGQMKRAGWDDK